MIRLSILPRDRAFTLIEVMVAMMLFVAFSLSMIGSILFASKATRLNSNAIAAKNVAQGLFEQMAADNFNNVTAANYPDIPFGTGAIYLDESLGIECSIDYEIKGYGIATSGTSTTLTDSSIPGDDSPEVWTDDEWIGDVVFFIDGAGQGQFSTITDNDSNTLTFDSVSSPPGNGTVYLINKGKTIEITTRWIYRGRPEPYQQTIESLIIKGADEEYDAFE